MQFSIKVHFVGIWLKVSERKVGLYPGLQEAQKWDIETLSPGFMVFLLYVEFPSFYSTLITPKAQFYGSGE